MQQEVDASPRTARAVSTHGGPETMSGAPPPPAPRPCAPPPPPLASPAPRPARDRSRASCYVGGSTTLQDDPQRIRSLSDTIIVLRSYLRVRTLNYRVPSHG